MARAVLLAQPIRLAADVEGIAGGRLHPEGRLQRLDARLEGLVRAALGQVFLVELAHQVELFPLPVRRQGRIAQIGEHLDRVEVAVVDVGALMLGREEAAAPQFREAHRPARTEDDVGRQVAVLRPQSVGEPGTHAGPIGGDRAVVEQEQSGTVVGVVGVQRAQDAQVVGAAGQVGQQLADLQPALTVLAVLEGHRHQPAGLVLGAQLHRRGPLASVLVEGRFRVE